MTGSNRPFPAVSVLMSVHDDARHVGEAMSGLLAQTMGDFELLVADDGSTDATPAILADFAASDARVRIFTGPNIGLTATLNRLLAEARAPLIARMDSDDVVLPERFARQCAFMAAHPEVGALGTQFWEIDDDGTVGERDFRHPLDHDGCVERLQRQVCLCHPTMMARADVLRGVGGYRIAYARAQDYDLMLRLSRVTRLANLPDVLLHYRRSARQASVTHNSEQALCAAIAWESHGQVLAGRPDPMASRTTLPAVDALDALFGQSGVSDRVRARLAGELRFSRAALSGPEFGMIRRHVARGGAMEGGWRTVARLMTFGMPLRAVRLALALAVGTLALLGGMMID